MKSAFRRTYGGPEVIEIAELEKPVPGPEEILVRVKSSNVSRADTMMRQGVPKFSRLFLGISKPKNTAIGTGFAGEIEQTGHRVTNFKAGQAVFGEVVFGNSANAEYVVISNKAVIKQIPSTCSFTEASTICDGTLTSYSFLKDIAKVQKSQHVLINGASGGLGTAAVQLVKILGASVTAVCSTANIKLVKSLGADHVIDYKVKDFTEDRDTYDIVFDTVGKSSYSKSKACLTRNGKYISPVLSLSLLYNMMLTSAISARKAKFSATGMRKPAELKALLDDICKFIEKGKLKSIIDKEYPLEDISIAHQYVDKGHKKGNVVLVS